MEACVIDAGWQTSDSTPPRLSASENEPRGGHDRRVSSSVAFSSNEHHATEAAHLLSPRARALAARQAG
jgi:hypothetical protein